MSDSLQPAQSAPQTTTAEIVSTTPQLTPPPALNPVPTQTLANAEPHDLLIAKAIENNVPVDTLERLLAMRRELKAEQARSEFFGALSRFQGACPVIEKKKTVNVKSQTASYKYNYADLGEIGKQIAPLMVQCGLSYSFDAEFVPNATGAGGAQVITCTVHHAAGHSETSEFRAPIDSTARMNDMQKNASSQTYAKRYALCNALGILTGDEDDDAQSVSGIEANTQRPAPRASTPAPLKPSAPPPSGAQPPQPAARPAGQKFYGGGDTGASQPQKNAIMAVWIKKVWPLALKTGMAAEDEDTHRSRFIKKVTGKDTIDSLTKREASALIDALDELAIKLQSQVNGTQQ